MFPLKIKSMKIKHFANLLYQVRQDQLLRLAGGHCGDHRDDGSRAQQPLIERVSS